MAIDTEPRISVRLDFDRSFYKELRKSLFKQGISAQEFFSYVIQLIVTGDKRIHEMLQEARMAQGTNSVASGIIHTDAESLFNIIEESSPLTKG